MEDSTDHEKHLVSLTYSTPADSNLFEEKELSRNSSLLCVNLEGEKK